MLLLSSAAVVALACLPIAAGCGFTVHMAVTHRAVNYFVGQSAPYSPLLLENRGAVEGGSSYPDYGYECGPNHDDGEYTHWSPYQWTAARYIRAHYPHPWSANGSILAAFHYGVVSHYIADLSWHGLQYFPTHYGLIETVGILDFNCSGALCSEAHTLSDTGGEFIAAFSTALPWDDPNQWVIPTVDLIAILRSDNRTQMQASDIEECALIFYAGAEAIRTVASLVEPMEVAPSPTFGEEFLGLPCGGLDDMAAYVARLWQRWASWLDRGPPTPPPGGEYCPGVCEGEGEGGGGEGHGVTEKPPAISPSDRAEGQRVMKSLYRILAPALLDSRLVGVDTIGGVTRIERKVAEGAAAARQAAVLAHLRRLMLGDAPPSSGKWVRATAGWTAPRPSDFDPEAVAALLLEAMRLGGVSPVLDALASRGAQHGDIYNSAGPKARVVLQMLEVVEAVSASPASYRAASTTDAEAAATLPSSAPLTPNASSVFASELPLEYAGSSLAVGDYDG